MECLLNAEAGNHGHFLSNRPLIGDARAGLCLVFHRNTQSTRDVGQERGFADDTGCLLLKTALIYEKHGEGGIRNAGYVVHSLVKIQRDIAPNLVTFLYVL